MKIDQVIEYLQGYDGRPLKLMEVCGTHTSSIFKNGIRSLISPKIKLISGPGCPVCVTPTAYIDKCLEYAAMDDHVLMTFGDMMKVPGTSGSLSDNKGSAANVEVIYSPFEALDKAAKHPERTYVVAAVGFETTTPVYGLLVREAASRGLDNIRLVTALKTIMPALSWICEHQHDIDGFICPGHVSVITGSRIYEDLAARYGKPFVVAGFEAEHILAVIYDIVRQISDGEDSVRNYYRNAVRDEGNAKAQQVISECFEADTATWRGLGAIPDSGMYLRAPYDIYDGGSRGLDQDRELPDGCRCADVITGRIDPGQCPMFGESCTPLEPFGPCMVSAEGACGIWFRNR